MSQLVLPHTIDAGTEVVAVEHQANYTAIRDTINGSLEGGTGPNANIAVDTVAAVNMADNVVLKGLNPGALSEGVLGVSDGRIDPGAGMVLNYTAGDALIVDDNGLVSAGALVPASWSAGSVTVPTAHATLTRIDQVIVTLTGYNTATVSVLQGTATAGANHANRLGAAALPAGAIRLLDIMTLAAFTGPFTYTTHLRPQRLYARSGGIVPPSVVAGNIIEMVTFRPYQAELKTNFVDQALGHDLRGAAVPMFLDHPIKGATRLKWQYQQGGAAVTGNWQMAIWSADKRLIVNTGNVAWAGALNTFQSVTAVITTTDFPAGMYYVGFWTDITSGASSAHTLATTMQMSNWVPSVGLVFVGAPAAGLGTPPNALPDVLTDIHIAGFGTNYPGVPVPSLSVQ